ncbi:hypothetical protein B0H19DRAFT_960679 [Mycena capillaripes]|nr:hypothetical protein B0H19DRAFT_960679 [Mycena capillaripes]
MTFIFAPTFDTKNPSTARKIHIRRVYDVMQMCIQRNDLERATRAWTILAHCEEINWRTMWSTSVHILAENLNDYEKSPKKVEFLRLMMLQHPEDRETILKEIVLRLILSRQYREALDELELYLPSLPYQDNSLLNVYAGLLSMYIAQPASECTIGLLYIYSWINLALASQFNPSLLRSAQSYFDRVKVLDPDNAMAEAFLQKVRLAPNSLAST